MASTGEGPPKPLDTKNDYDGRSLLEVVQSEGRLRPSTWPETDEPPIHTTPVTQPATALDEADKALIYRGVWDRIVPGKSHRWYQAASKDAGKSWDISWTMDWVRV